MRSIWYENNESLSLVLVFGYLIRDIFFFVDFKDVKKCLVKILDGRIY